MEDDDHDGLTTLQEYKNSTNPKADDTDGDNLPNGWELNYGLNLHINDANDDPDNDGISNVREFLNGTRPNFLGGDVNGDDKSDLANVIITLQILTGQTPTGVQPGADINGDGKIGPEEAIFIMQDGNATRYTGKIHIFYSKGLMIVSVLSITKPCCISSETR